MLLYSKALFDSLDVAAVSPNHDRSSLLSKITPTFHFTFSRIFKWSADMSKVLLGKNSQTGVHIDVWKVPAYPFELQCPQVTHIKSMEVIFTPPICTSFRESSHSFLLPISSYSHRVKHV